MPRVCAPQMDDSLQPTVDMLLNVSIMMWYGAVCPWHSFAVNAVIPLYRLVPLGILVLLFRRLPWVLAIHKFIPQIEEVRQAIFVGFFGPVGVSAIFYLYITLEFLNTVTTTTDDGGDEIRADVKSLPEVVNVVVWFIAICSIVGLLLFSIHLFLSLSLSLSLYTESTRPQPLHSRALAHTHRLDRPRPLYSPRQAGLLPPAHALAHSPIAEHQRRGPLAVFPHRQPRQLSRASGRSQPPACGLGDIRRDVIRRRRHAAQPRRVPHRRVGHPRSGAAGGPHRIAGPGEREAEKEEAGTSGIGTAGPGADHGRRGGGGHARAHHPVPRRATAAGAGGLEGECYVIDCYRRRSLSYLWQPMATYGSMEGGRG